MAIFKITLLGFVVVCMLLTFIDHVHSMKLHWVIRLVSLMGTVIALGHLVIGAFKKL